MLSEQVERGADRVDRGVHAGLEVGEHDTVDRLRFHLAPVDGFVDAGAPATGLEVFGHRDRVGVVDQALVSGGRCVTARSERPPSVEAQPCPRQQQLTTVLGQSDKVAHERHTERHCHVGDDLDVTTLDCLISELGGARDSMNSSWGLSAAGKS